MFDDTNPVPVVPTPQPEDLSAIAAAHGPSQAGEMPDSEPVEAVAPSEVSVEPEVSAATMTNPAPAETPAAPVSETPTPEVLMAQIQHVVSVADPRDAEITRLTGLLEASRQHIELLQSNVEGLDGDLDAQTARTNTAEASLALMTQQRDQLQAEYERIQREETNPLEAFVQHIAQRVKASL